MHEMSIAAALIQALETEARRQAGAQVRRAAVKVGELAGIDPDALRFCFEVLVRDTVLRNVELEIQLCARRHRCTSCGRVFNVRNYDFQCPECGESNTEFIGGDELELVYLEVEEHGACTLGTQSSE